MPTFRPPVAGSRVITAGSVMNGAGSPGQQRWIGRTERSTSSPRSTISWTGPRRTVFGIESAIDFSFWRPRTLSISPDGGCISRMSLSLWATSSSRSTPKARHIRRSVPNWLIRSGCCASFGRSNRSAGPPALTVRSTISVISRSGSTSAATRTSSPSRSRSEIQSRRSFTDTAPSLRRALRCLTQRRDEVSVTKPPLWCQTPEGLAVSDTEGRSGSASPDRRRFSVGA